MGAVINLLYNWIKNIAFYLILITAIENAVPNNSYKKYIKLVTGMILVVLLVSPITGFLNLEEVIEKTFSAESYKYDVEDMKKGSKYLENVQTDYLTEAYAKEVKEKTEEIVSRNGLYLLDVQVEVERDIDSDDFGALQNIKIVASYDKKASSEIAVDKIKIGDGQESVNSYEVVTIKNEIQDFYNIPDSNINISIQR